MKQLFALFCAFALMPSFSAHAWIGGPFSGNTYFGENGDDGIYEAVAVPQEPGLNGIGLYRWAVTNQFTGIDSGNISTFTYTSGGGGSSDFLYPSSGNLNFGGITQFAHSWFIQGVTYYGFCSGIVNSGLGVISATGLARQPSGATGTFANISSGFQASFTNTGNGIPIRRFEGFGRGISTDTTLGEFRFFVFGSKVSNEILFFNG